MSIFSASSVAALQVPWNSLSSQKQANPQFSPLSLSPKSRTLTWICHRKLPNKHIFTEPTLLGLALVLASTSLAFPGISSAAQIPFLEFQEPENALSLPTWAVHVSSVVEWIIAMVLVWQYGEKSGYESWKGLSWGMVPLLGGAFCACTWHFFYNAESLDVLVALQAALTVIGNLTMCIAAFRIYKSSKGGSENP